MDSLIFHIVVWEHNSLLRNHPFAFSGYRGHRVTQSYAHSFRLRLESSEEEWIHSHTVRKIMFCLFLFHIRADAFILNTIWFETGTLSSNGSFKRVVRCLQHAACFEYLCLKWIYQSRNCFCDINYKIICAASPCTGKFVCTFFILQRKFTIFHFHPFRSKHQVNLVKHPNWRRRFVQTGLLLLFRK